MSRVSAPAVRGTLLGALLRLWNPLMRRLIDSPVHWPLSRWFAVLAWTGSKTGRRYSTPVSYVREGRTAYVTTGDRWWRNLTGGAPVAMRIAGRWQEGTAAPLTDLPNAAPSMRGCFANTPGSGGWPASPVVRKAVQTPPRWTGL